ncbi:MAG: transposase [Asgard group archaeon]|nr:transposase [Asgard group archaeon]
MSTWQIHWFFSRIIQLSTSIARRNGIRTEIVNPYKTSKICSTCGKEGSRKSKKFKCTHHLCKLQLDSDLNAARNIGNVNRKCYPVQL